MNPPRLASNPGQVNRLRIAGNPGPCKSDLFYYPGSCKRALSLCCVNRAFDAVTFLCAFTWDFIPDLVCV